MLSTIKKTAGVPSTIIIPFLAEKNPALFPMTNKIVHQFCSTNMKLNLDKCKIKKNIHGKMGFVNKFYGISALSINYKLELNMKIDENEIRVGILLKPNKKGNTLSWFR